MGRRIGPAHQHGELAKADEVAHRYAGPLPVLHRLEAGLEIEAHGLVGGQRCEQVRLAHARRPENGAGRLEVGF